MSTKRRLEGDFTPIGTPKAAKTATGRRKFHSKKRKSPKSGAKRARSVKSKPNPDGVPATDIPCGGITISTSSTTSGDNTTVTSLLYRFVTTEETERVIDEEQLDKWRRIQDEMKSEVIEANTEAWQTDESFEGLCLIGGVDISFVKDSTKACVALVVCSYPELEVVETVIEEIEMTVPYASGFLAFREVGFFEECLQKLKCETPQVIMVDGNGILHQRGFGVACHLGVRTGIPCIGVAKKLMQIDGLEKDANFQLKKKESLKISGDSFDLVGDSLKVWGKALRSTAKSNNPIFVSVGHKVSLDTATRLVHSCCRHRVPEPVRQADILSREKIRVDP